jgi:hypothetical protein
MLWSERGSGTGCVSVSMNFVELGVCPAIILLYLHDSSKPLLQLFIKTTLCLATVTVTLMVHGHSHGYGHSPGYGHSHGHSHGHGYVQCPKT